MEGKAAVQILINPLHLLHQIQRGVHEKLVHVQGFRAEFRQAIAALFRGAEGEFEERVVEGADYGEVVGHFPLIRLWGKEGRREYWGGLLCCRRCWRSVSRLLRLRFGAEVRREPMLT